METEITKTETKEVTKVEANPLEGSGIDMSDIALGRISILQSNSKLIKEDDIGKSGEIYNLLLRTKLGDAKNKFEYIPIGSFKYWDVFERTGKNKTKLEFIKRLPAINAKQYAWEEGDIKRVFNHSFYFLLPSECASGDDLPYIFTFKSTGLKACKDLCGFIFRSCRKGGNMWDKTYTMTTTISKNEDNSWSTPVIGVGRDSTDEEKSCSVEWNRSLRTVSEKVMNEVPEEDVSKKYAADENAPF